MQQRDTDEESGGTGTKWRHERRYELTPLDVEAARQEGVLDQMKMQQQKDLVHRLKDYHRGGQ